MPDTPYPEWLEEAIPWDTTPEDAKARVLAHIDALTAAVEALTSATDVPGVGRLISSRDVLAILRGET